MSNIIIRFLLILFLHVLHFQFNVALATGEITYIKKSDIRDISYEDIIRTSNYHYYGRSSTLAHMSYKHLDEYSGGYEIFHPCISIGEINPEKRKMELMSPFLRDYCFFPEVHEKLKKKSFFYGEMPYFIDKEKDLFNYMAVAMTQEPMDSCAYKYYVSLLYSKVDSYTNIFDYQIVTFYPMIKKNGSIYILTWIEKNADHKLLFQDNVLYLYSTDQQLFDDIPAIVLSDFLKLKFENNKIIGECIVIDNVILTFEINLECEIESSNYILGWKKSDIKTN